MLNVPVFFAWVTGFSLFREIKKYKCMVIVEGFSLAYVGGCHSTKEERDFLYFARNKKSLQDSHLAKLTMHFILARLDTNRHKYCADLLPRASGQVSGFAGGKRAVATLEAPPDPTTLQRPAWTPHPKWRPRKLQGWQNRWVLLAGCVTRGDIPAATRHIQQGATHSQLDRHLEATRSNGWDWEFTPTVLHSISVANEMLPPGSCAFDGAASNTFDFSRCC